MPRKKKASEKSSHKSAPHLAHEHTSWFLWMRQTYLSDSGKKKARKRTIIGWFQTWQVALASVAFLLISIGVLTLGPQILKITDRNLGLPKGVVNAFNQEASEAAIPKQYVRFVENKGVPAPTFASIAVLAEDLQTGTMLYEKNTHQKMPPASTTKIMTALVAIEHFKDTDILSVPKEALVGGSTMGLAEGERLAFGSLLYGMMLNSGNDAAFAIAMNYPGGLVGFVAAMNQKSQDLGLLDTHFDNPAGFDSPTHYSSAYDLIKISAIAMQDPELAAVVSTKEASVQAVDGQRLHVLKNLNKLLGEPGVLGVKTGFTEKAGENFVGLVERDGKRVLTVVLNSPDRFAETKQLIEWIYLNYEWKEEYR